MTPSEHPFYTFMTCFFAFLTGFFGWAWWKNNRWLSHNDIWTPKNSLLEQMNEPRPLPMGQKEFDVWAARILSGALIPTTNPESLKAALAMMIIQLPATESHKPDAYFINSLRKAAANEVAHSNYQAIKKAREEAAQCKVTPIA